MSGKIFVDTNVLVYAHDQDSGVKHGRAKYIALGLWESESGVISTQVLQELYMALRHKVSNPLPAGEAERVLFDYLSWEIVVNARESVIRAIALEARYKISFWDALILQAAECSGCDVIYSEDLNHGQVYGSVKVMNPFR